MIEKVNFLLIPNITTTSELQVVNGKLVISRLDLTQILKDMFWRYKVFNLKLEGFSTGVVGENGQSAKQYTCLHVLGLQWLNGYDTLNYDNSRVVEIVSFEIEPQTYDGQIYGYSFIGNNNNSMFYRPSNGIINDFTYYFSDMNGNILTWLTSNSIPNLMFSITGVEKFREPHFPRYKELHDHAIVWTLKCCKATVLDTYYSAYKFSSYNMANVMGEAYYKYNRFKLITKSICFTDWNNYMVAGDQQQAGYNMMSGLNWAYPVFPVNKTGSDWGNSNFAVYHTEMPTCIGVNSIKDSPTPSSYTQEISSENIMFRPKSVCDIVITLSNTTQVINRTMYTNAVYNMRPTFIFNIIPID